MNKILVVDDDLDILEFLKYNLDKEGFDVFTAETGALALKLVGGEKPDLLLLDVMLPDIDGIEICMRIREMKDINQPVIAFLTARNEDYSQIAGLEAGGDDYIAKPIKPRLLISRVKALLRRPQEQMNENDEKGKIFAGPISIDFEKYLVMKNEEEIHFPRKQFNILSLLASSPGKVIRREQIMDRIWGDSVVVSDRNIDVQIRKIREKIGDNMIRTIKGVGYKFDLS